MKLTFVNKRTAIGIILIYFKLVTLPARCIVADNVAPIQGKAEDVWKQIGSDIDGEAMYDEFGYSVALSKDGIRLAIGAPGNDENGTDSGHVRVFETDGEEWFQIGSDIDGRAFEVSGFSVSLSGDGSRVAVGAVFKGVDVAGGVSVFEIESNEWVQLGSDINGEDSYDLSGSSVSLSDDGSIVAIGAPENGKYGSGHVRVLSFDGSNWNQLGDDIDGEADFDNSGFSVSLSSDGKTVAIGAYLNYGSVNQIGNEAGHVRVYVFDGTNWNQQGSDIDGESSSDFSGFSVSLSSDGTIVAIGSVSSSDNGDYSGHVRVFKQDNSDWIQLGSDIEGEDKFDLSGSSVSLSSDGTKVAIGASGNNDNGYYSGHVRIFEYNENGDWVQLGQDIDGEVRDLTGRSVSLSGDGDRVAVGGFGNVYFTGHARVFEFKSSSEESEEPTVEPEEPIEESEEPTVEPEEPTEESEEPNSFFDNIIELFFRIVKLCID